MPTKKAGAAKPGKGQAEIGIIGGSGLYSMPGLERAREVRVKTPFGEPSDAFVVGTLEGRRVAFLARHGRGHRILPSEINYRANLYAMKLLGVRARHFGQRGRIPARGFAAAGIFDPRPVFRPHAPPHFHVFRRRNRGSCGL